MPLVNGAQSLAEFDPLPSMRLNDVPWRIGNGVSQCRIFGMKDSEAACPELEFCRSASCIDQR